RTATSPAKNYASRLVIYGGVYDDSVELSLLKEVEEHICGTRNAGGHHLRISRPGRRSVSFEDRNELGSAGIPIPDAVIDLWMRLLTLRKKLWRDPMPLADVDAGHYACTVVKRGRVYFCDSLCPSSKPDKGMIDQLKSIHGVGVE
ncbi:hypothetical protein FOZ61_003380, partial [Perkinsus olseni]